MPALCKFSTPGEASVQMTVCFSVMSVTSKAFLLLTSERVGEGKLFISAVT